MPDQTDVRTFSANVLTQYNRVHVNGERPSDVARDMGVTGSTVSSNVKRVRDAIAAGATVTTDDASATVAASSAPVTVDRMAIADDMVDAGADYVFMWDRHTATIDDITARVDTMRRDADRLAATVAATEHRRARLVERAAADGFDFDAFHAAVDAAIAAANAPTDDDDATGDDAPTGDAPTGDDDDDDASVDGSTDA